MHAAVCHLHCHPYDVTGLAFSCHAFQMPHSYKYMPLCHVCCALFSVTLYAQLHCFTLSVALDGTGAGRLEVVPYWLNLVRYTWSLHIFHTLLATPFT